MMGYYDVVLGLIPVSLLGITGVLAGVGFDLVLAVRLAAVVCAAITIHALFVRAPVTPDDRNDRPTAPPAD